MGMHEGHRARLQGRFDAEGLDAFYIHEALELLLFYSVARRDVNPLAHRLIKRFGSLGGVLDAGEEALKTVPGVGSRTAALLAFLPDFLAFYRGQQPQSRPLLGNLSAAKAYCRKLMGSRDGEHLWMLHLGGDGCLIAAEGFPADSRLPGAQQLVVQALKNRAQAIILAARRPCTNPNDEDRAFTGALKELLGMVGVVLVDALFFCEGGMHSLRREGVLSSPLREPCGRLLGPDDGWLD